MKPNTEFDPRDIVIHFRDLILYVLLRWRSILIVALIGALALGGLKFWKDTNHYNHQIQADLSAPVETEPEDPVAVAVAQRYQTTYLGYCEYVLSAPLMQVDPMKTPVQRMNYLVSGARSYAAAALIQTRLADESVYENDLSMPAAYLQDLVNVTLSQEQTDQAADCVIVNVEVAAPTRELCDTVAQMVRDAVKNVSATVNTAVGAYTGNWVYDSALETAADWVRTQQKNVLKEQKQALTDLTTAKEALSSADVAYLEQSGLVAGVGPAKPSVSKKFVVLGFLAGGALMVLWYAAMYLFCGRILSETDVAVRHGAVVFGSLAGDKKRCCVDRLLRRWLQDPDADPDLMWQRVALAAKAAQVNTVYLTGDAAAVAGLPQALEAAGITLQCGASPLVDAAALDTLAAADALLVVAKTEQDSHRQLAGELAAAQQLERKALGVILVK